MTGTESGTDATTTTSEDTTAGPGTGSETGVEEVDIPARGISIEWVQANQGIGVKIGEDGGAVGGADRNAYLVQGRTTLIRAFWTIPEDWTAREIEARLTITYEDDTPDLVMSHTLLIDANPFEGELNRSFFWGLKGTDTGPDTEEGQNQVKPGMEYKIELFETDPMYADLPEGDLPPRTPYEGTAFVGIEDSYQIIRVIVVPFNLPSGTESNPTCTTSYDNIDDGAKQRFHNYMYMMNPVDTVETFWHEPIDFNGQLVSLGQMNSIMADLRTQEVPDQPDVYYYGIVDPCSGGVQGAAGLANGIPSNPLKSNAYQRVSSGVLLGSAATYQNQDLLNVNADTYVHEVGHCQGRRHVTCSGGEGGPDPAYPIEGGDIGEWGWGVMDFGLKHPTVYKDYMTYCNPAWVSNYGWNKVYPIIQTLSSWDFEDTSQDGGDLFERHGTLLRGHIYPNGSADWNVIPGSLGTSDVPWSAAHHVEVKRGNDTLDLKVTAERLDDGTMLLTAPLADGEKALDGAQSIVWVADDTDTRTTFPASLLGKVREYRQYAQSPIR